MWLRAEIRFLGQLIKANILSAMEYRESFLIQVFGMLLNDGIYFVFWIIFFDRFGNIGNYQFNDILLIFAVVNLSFGLASLFSGNTGPNLANMIAQGRLDYFLILPRNLVLHLTFSRMRSTAISDIIFGVLVFLFTEQVSAANFIVFLFVGCLAAMILLSLSIIIGSLAFFFGNSQQASRQVIVTVKTLSIYPQNLFSGFSKFILYTILPASLISSVPVDFITNRKMSSLSLLIGAVILFWVIAIAVFYYGIRRYESGNAINVIT